MFFKDPPLFFEAFDDKLGRRQFNSQPFGRTPQFFLVKDHFRDEFYPGLS